jgi:putative ABC transport system permease protein
MTAGAIAGLLASFVAVRALRSLLFGVTADDPLTYAVVFLALILAAGAGALLPARTATRIDPASALKGE